MAFGDVNLSQEPIRGNHNPGAGGWPTIRYFNSDTGYEGRNYDKKTSKSMCDELGDDSYMQAYVEEAGMTSLCQISDISNCSEKESEYYAKNKDADAGTLLASLSRLSGMTGGVMKPDLKKWLHQRISLLKQLNAADTLKAEL